MTFGDTTERYLASLVIEKQPADKSVAVPEPGKADNQFSYVVKRYLDQYGNDYPVEGTPEILWKINGSYTGVTIEENTGVVTVTSTAADNSTIRVTATCRPGAPCCQDRGKEDRRHRGYHRARGRNDGHRQGSRVLRDLL